MEKSLQEIIFIEVNNLIDKSCEKQDGYAIDFSSFHRALIKKHFECESVVINRERGVIILEMMTENNLKKTKILDVKVDFKNFDKFLKSCVVQSPHTLLFYKNMLQHYHSL